MTNRQSGKEQIPSVTGNLAQMIVWVCYAAGLWVSESRKTMGGKIISKSNMFAYCCIGKCEWKWLSSVNYMVVVIYN